MKSLAGLLLALALGGCVTLTPAQEQSVSEIRAFADETARVYGVSRISVLVGSNIEGVGGSYRRGFFTVSTPMLNSRHRDSVVAHEMAHYLLDHDRPLAGTMMYDWTREQEQRELAANAKAVEVLVRVRRLPEERALSLVYDHLLSFNWLVGEKRTVIPWGHLHPCEEMVDLLRRFPAHRAWTDGLECSGGARGPAVVPAAAPPAAPDAASAGVIVQSYFTNRPPAASAPLRESDPASLPRAFQTFDRSRDFQVSLFLGVRPGPRPLRVISRWYDETGAERRVVTRTVESAAAGATWAWHTHTVPMWELRPYPGRWKAKIWVDEAAVGEWSFSLAR
ncbi:MAG TPA: hypothetical protein VGT02_09060 [Methylomirabilota bacterium]|nr:hypothetical protein [Methylomirabilota bacterium]